MTISATRIHSRAEIEHRAQWHGTAHSAAAAHLLPIQTQWRPSGSAELSSRPARVNKLYPPLESPWAPRSVDMFCACAASVAAGPAARPASSRCPHKQHKALISPAAAWRPRVAAGLAAAGGDKLTCTLGARSPALTSLFCPYFKRHSCALLLPLQPCCWRPSQLQRRWTCHSLPAA